MVACHWGVLRKVLRHPGGSDHHVGRTPRPPRPVGPQLWGMRSPTNSLQVASTDLARLPAPKPMGPRLIGGYHPLHALRQGPEPGQDSLSPSRGPASTQAAITCTSSLDIDHRLDRTPPVPLAGGPEPMGIASLAGALPVATAAQGGLPVPTAGGTAPKGAVVPHRRSSGSDNRPGGTPRPSSWWDRAAGSFRLPQALPEHRPPTWRDTPPPQQVGLRLWGMLSPTMALHAATTA